VTPITPGPRIPTHLPLSARGPRPGRRPRIAAAVGVVALWLLPACSDQSGPDRSATARRANELEVVFTYGSEKQPWIDEVTAAFNGQQRRTDDGRVIRVTAVPMGSGECIDEALTGGRQVHLTSPASAAFITLGNARSRARTGRDLIPETQNLVLSPVVIAMWKPMAEALDWGRKPIGWSDILDLARAPSGWTGRGFGQWGALKFGHTHPEYSNSGLIAVLASVYAAAGKTAGLTLEDVRRPAVGAFIGEIERAVVHYGSSTGFFGRQMFASGPNYLSAAVLYENMVIEAADRRDLPLPVVAIYPKEGTFWSDHPAGLVDREWVSPSHRAAAKAYLSFLVERPQQERAIAFGFRPALVDIPLAAPIDAAHGVDPREPQTTLAVPSAEVINGVLDLWRRHKKRSQVTLVLDTSGSMEDDRKLQYAQEGARQLIAMLDDDDEFSLATFSGEVHVLAEGLRIGDARAQAIGRIDSLVAGGSTRLYDAVDRAYRLASARASPDRIHAIVVLSDGADTGSGIALEQLLPRITFDNELRTTRVFTIAYGDKAKRDVLERIAAATRARSYEGTPKNIVTVFKDVSTFF